jgi:hypothetical protein
MSLILIILYLSKLPQILKLLERDFDINKLLI